MPIENLTPPSDRPETRKTIDGVTDFAGDFILNAVPEGTYVIQVTKDGYSDDLEFVRLVLAQLKPEQQKSILASFPQVEVHPGSEIRQNVIIRRAAAISGKVLADDGGALGSHVIQATLLSSPVFGDLPKDTEFKRRGQADDRGMFRIAGLPAGKYNVSIRLSEDFLNVSVAPDHSVIMRASRVGTGHLEVFAPDAFSRPDAKTISVRDGDDLSDVEITVPFHKLHSIGGHAVGAGQKPVAGAIVSIQRTGDGPTPNQAVSDGTGSYRFDLLPPGTYIIQTRGPARPDGKPQASFGTRTVELSGFDIVDADVSAVQVERP